MSTDVTASKVVDWRERIEATRRWFKETVPDFAEQRREILRQFPKVAEVTYDVGPDCVEVLFRHVDGVCAGTVSLYPGSPDDVTASLIGDGIIRRFTDPLDPDNSDFRSQRCALKETAADRAELLSIAAGLMPTIIARYGTDESASYEEPAQMKRDGKHHAARMKEVAKIAWTYAKALQWQSQYGDE